MSTKVAVTILVIAAVLIGLFVWQFGLPGEATDNGETACTLEAKICPDGTVVGRTGPNCEFAKCPGE